MATVLNSHRILRATFTFTIVMFFFAIGLGIFQSLSSYHRLPPINSHYMSEITALIENEDYDKAIPQLQLATSIDPDADASKNRDLVTSVRAAAATTSGKSLKDTGRFDEAILQYQKALIFLPDSATAHYNLANALQYQNRNQEALEHYQSTLRLEPTHAKAHGNMGGILQGHGRIKEALAHYEQALQLEPDSVEAQNNLAWLLATCHDTSVRNGQRAVDLAERAANATQYKQVSVLDTLAAAYAEVGNFATAVKWQQKAIELAAEQQKGGLERRLQRYRAGLPFHDQPIASSTSSRQ